MAERNSLNVVVDGAVVDGLVDVVEFTEKPNITTETKNSKMYGRYSGEGNTAEMVVKVLTDSGFYAIMDSLCELTNFYPVMGFTSSTIKTLTAKNAIEKFCGNLGLSVMGFSAQVDTSNNFSREASPEEAITKLFRVYVRVLQKPTLLEI